MRVSYEPTFTGRRGPRAALRLQVLDPFQKAARPALLVGLRAKLDF
ncbi:MAG TPA: hypothetical protein VM597_18160 [Gemmataceae bacterium]|nr:hypothetical protein [Gemmataceae bacterium]